VAYLAAEQVLLLADEGDAMTDLDRDLRRLTVLRSREGAARRRRRVRVRQELVLRGVAVRQTA